MPYQDFRQFLDVLRQQGELIDVNRPIALTDVGKALKQAYQKGRPAVSFNDNGTEFPLVCGLYSDRNKALLAFQADEKTILQKVLDGLDSPIAPRMLKGDAPYEVVITGDDIDINRFPIPTYSPKDGGPYITPGIVVSKDPETGVPDIGHYRFLILGKDTLLVLGAAIPPLRQEPGEMPEDGRHAQGCAGHRRRSDPGLHLPGAGA